jgi:hypothetical protein
MSIAENGRIQCGGFTLNPDLTIHGKHGWPYPDKAERVTDEVRQAIAVSDAVREIRNFQPYRVPAANIIAAADLLKVRKE